MKNCRSYNKIFKKPSKLKETNQNQIVKINELFVILFNFYSLPIICASYWYYYSYPNTLDFVQINSSSSSPN